MKRNNGLTEEPPRHAFIRLSLSIERDLGDPVDHGKKSEVGNPVGVSRGLLLLDIEAMQAARKRQSAKH